MSNYSMLCVVCGEGEDYDDWVPPPRYPPHCSHEEYDAYELEFLLAKGWVTFYVCPKHRLTHTREDAEREWLHARWREDNEGGNSD